MKKKLIKIWNLLWEIFVIFVFLSCAGLAISIFVVMPNLSIGCLVASIGFKLIDWYSSRNNKGDK